MEEPGGGGGGGEDSSAVAEPYPPSPPGDDNPPPSSPQLPVAGEPGSPRCHQAESGSLSSSPPSGSDLAVPKLVALEAVGNAAPAGDGDAVGGEAARESLEEADDAQITQCEQAVDHREAEVSMPRGSLAASPSLSDGGFEKVKAFEPDASDIAAGDDDLLKEPLRMDLEEVEKTPIPQSQREDGVQEQVSMPQGLPDVASSAFDGSLLKPAASEILTTATVACEEDSVKEAMSKMDVDSVPIPQWHQRKDFVQEQVLMPRDLPAVPPSGSDGGLLKFAAFETDATDASEEDSVKEALSKMDVDSVPIPQWHRGILMPQGLPVVSSSRSDSGLLKFAAFESDATTSSAGGKDSVREAMSKMDVDSVPISQCNQGKDFVQKEVLMPQGSPAVSPSGSGGSLLKFAAFESDATDTNAGDDDAVGEAAPKMYVDSAPVPQCHQGKDGVQGEVLMPQGSPAVSSSGLNGGLLKFGAFDIDTSANNADDTATVEEEVPQIDVDGLPNVTCKQADVCEEVDVSMPKSPSAMLPFGSGGGLEKIASCEPVAVATTCDDDAVKEVALACADTLDNVPLPLYEQMVNAEMGTKMLRGSLDEFPSVSDRGDENIAAIEPDAASTSYGKTDAMDDEAAQMDAETDDTLVVVRAGGGRRKRGRPTKSQVVRTPLKRKEEEEVCFICFDGGDLVVCDRRGCPKVYHPSCVNRDEAFFRSKGRWTCGWHICSSCERSALYMCFTCTHSLCRGCIKEAGFFCVRGNKGFCETCMSTVMLIETNAHGNQEMVGVDFDDKSSFEYLFKDYWLDLKAKLSLSLEELTRAKNPMKRSDVAIGNEESSDDLHHVKEEQIASSDSSSEHKEESISSRRKVRKKSRNTINEEVLVKEVETPRQSVCRDISWASDELLEFVAHMKNGDRSVLSQFDVQGLLLDYIKRNNLRDPRKKSQIICDSRLKNLFGKPCVGHFEMLKLLESHFLIKEVSPLDTEDKQGGVVDPDPDPDPDPDQTDTKGNSDASMKLAPDKRRKTRKKVEKELLTNLDDYAAIDTHNISLMYLRRNLMEELLDDISFDEIVIGSFVRIRISGVGQRQDMYRLVQVVGTGKAAESYKSGKKTTDVTLETINLNKKEVITIDSISNQEFTEEECKRLRQSIKCGFIGRLTVGDVQEKARSLQPVRVNDWLESEKLRLGHLRDRASEKGRRKELRECIEKLQLLNTPEECNRRLNEVPEIHTDPHMDPDYESAEEEEESDLRKQDYYDRSRGSSFLRNGREVKSPGKGSSTLSDNRSSSRKNSNTWDSNRSALVDGASIADSSAGRDVNTTEFSLNQANDVRQANSSEASKSHVTASVSDASLYHEKQHMIRSEQSADGQQENQIAPLPGDLAAVANESDKIWHYQDPSGKIQGPFSMTQLRKWSNTGYFPPNLRIWRASEKQEDSILLSDALVGKFQKDLPEWEPPHNSTSQSVIVSPTGFSAGPNLVGVQRGSDVSALSNIKQNAQKLSISQNEKWATRQASWASPKMEVSSRGRVSPKEANGKSGQAQEQNSPRPLSPLNGNQPPALSYQVIGSQVNTASRSDSYYENPHPNWSSTSQQLPSSNSEVEPVNDSYHRRNGSTNVPPTPQPSKKSLIAEGSLNKHLPSSASVQAIASAWVNTGGREEPQSSFTTNEPSRGISNSLRELGSFSSQSVPEQTVTSGGGQSLAASLSAPDTVFLGQATNLSHHPDEVDAAGSFQKKNSELELSFLLQSQHDHGKESLRTRGRSADETRKKSERLSIKLDTSVSSEDPKEKFHATEVGNITPAASSNIYKADSERNPVPLTGFLDNQIHQALTTSYPGSDLMSEKVSSRAPNLSAHPSDAASNLFVQSDALESSSAQRSQTSANANAVPVQPNQLGFDTGSNVQNTSFPVASQNPSPNSGPLQGTGNMSWTPMPQGNINVGWGMVAQGNMNMPWGQPAQAIAGLNMGLGAQNQVNTMMNPGWVAPAQGNTNMNVAWVTPVAGNTNQTSGWGGHMQGNLTINPVWAMLLQGQPNPNPGWAAPPYPNANQNLEAPMQGTVNMNSAWGSGQGNMNPSWVPSAGNPQSSSIQPMPSHGGDRNSGQGDNLQGNDSGHTNQRPLWNRTQAGGGSSLPPRGQTGICRFHEMGHCKKGASCNYFHS
ncbi:zinc finger CCCH domain-containing protein 19-like [Musa acuminata AAA Group]|uniref:zinc finger CCCH domain-containing protein 19-like n=1 Tax=Musa acuminata AAA Group TaxID=214697 RepID=UPI0031D5D724